MTTTPNLSKLRRLADFLEFELPQQLDENNRFVMAAWFDTTWVQEPSACDTAGCAIGWAAAHNAVEGLSLAFDATSTPMYGTVHYRGGGFLAQAGDRWLDFGRNGFLAARHVFNLTANEAAVLFSTGWYWIGDETETALPRVEPHLLDIAERTLVPEGVANIPPTLVAERVRLLIKHHEEANT